MRFCWITNSIRSQRHCSWFAPALLLVCWCPAGALADGCFVWHWDKKADINEPAQKAIILYDAGREDLLLQVKYEGSLQEFGWLIPVPSPPQVEKGSMEAFYELSQLTQRAFVHDGRSVQSRGLSAASAGPAPVKVIEIKTVGAYEVAVLSARDAGSLARWLKAHDYTIPEGKSGIINDYISRGWFFVAARIDLGGPVGLKPASLADNGSRSAAAKARSTVQRKLAEGELPPLRISFDTPTCVFPLKISAVAGKPSEVSIYVLSEPPLLSPFLFDKARKLLDQQCAKWALEKPERERRRIKSWQNLQAMALGRQLRFSAAYGRASRSTDISQEWTADDLAAAASEGMPSQPLWGMDEEFYASSQDLLPLLGGSFSDTVTVAMATRLIEGTGLIRRPSANPPGEESERRNRLSSQEVAPLLTNKAAMVRIAGLVILRRNADAKAVELSLPHLRETNRVVRSLAYETIREISGQDLSRTDPAKWDRWWAANKAAFVPPPRSARNERD